MTNKRSILIITFVIAVITAILIGWFLQPAYRYERGAWSALETLADKVNLHDRYGVTQWIEAHFNEDASIAFSMRRASPLYKDSIQIANNMTFDKPSFITFIGYLMERYPYSSISFSGVDAADTNNVEDVTFIFTGRGLSETPGRPTNPMMLKSDFSCIAHARFAGNYGSYKPVRWMSLECNTPIVPISERQAMELP